MGETEGRRGRRRWWRRRGLPRSRTAVALAGLLTVVVAVLALLGSTRARPGRIVPSFVPATTTTTAFVGPVRAPTATAVAPSTTRRR